ncbi:MAG: peroxiredoxin [Chloroflexi bacterium 44-23]|nr:MAG: peroxiredoxin [Chloroflexi bacterium 44-23]
MAIQKGLPAPDFILNDENGKPHSLSDYKGKAVVLYFYPKDDTAGCTTEACEFRDDFSVYKQADVTILGVSPDDEKSHKKFKQKYELPFTILADVGHKVCDLYGVWGEKSMYGKKYFGVKRTTFLIDADGNILDIFENVKPKGHSAQVLASLN